MLKAPDRSLTAAHAILTVERFKQRRVYAETPALQLLEMQDEITARLSWHTMMVRRPQPGDAPTLEAVNVELKRRADDELAQAAESFARRNKFHSLFPDNGPLGRDKYPKQVAFFAAGTNHRERGLFGSNRSGKTLTAGYELTAHVTGRYPAWWPGIRFKEPIDAWIANKGSKEVRDVNEAELYGTPGNPVKRGTGMIPGHLIMKTDPKPGTKNAIEFGYIQHVSGSMSTVQSKSFDQGRESFQGTSKKLIWLDEESPEDVYTECLLRTLDCGGIIMLTYTPLQGLTTLTVRFLEEAGINIEDIGAKMADEDG